MGKDFKAFMALKQQAIEKHRKEKGDAFLRVISYFEMLRWGRDVSETDDEMAGFMEDAIKDEMANRFLTLDSSDGLTLRDDLLLEVYRDAAMRAFYTLQSTEFPDFYEKTGPLAKTRLFVPSLTGDVVSTMEYTDAMQGFAKQFEKTFLDWQAASEDRFFRDSLITLGRTTGAVDRLTELRLFRLFGHTEVIPRMMSDSQKEVLLQTHRDLKLQYGLVALRMRRKQMTPKKLEEHMRWVKETFLETPLTHYEPHGPLYELGMIYPEDVQALFRRSDLLGFDDALSEKVTFMETVLSVRKQYGEQLLSQQMVRDVAYWMNKNDAMWYQEVLSHKEHIKKICHYTEEELREYFQLIGYPLP